jgi:hypothetical protein
MADANEDLKALSRARDEKLAEQRKQAVQKDAENARLLAERVSVLNGAALDELNRMRDFLIEDGHRSSVSTEKPSSNNHYHTATLTVTLKNGNGQSRFIALRATGGNHISYTVSDYGKTGHPFPLPWPLSPEVIRSTLKKWVADQLADGY